MLASYQIYAVKDDKDGVATKEAPLSKWWDAYPIAKSSPSSITPDELAALLRGPEKGEVAVVDVRRNDHAVRVFNLPYHSGFDVKFRAGTSVEAFSIPHKRSSTSALHFLTNLGRQSVLYFIVGARMEEDPDVLDGMTLQL